MKITGKLFVAVVFMVFLAACCHGRHPNFNRGEHPVYPEASYFILQKIYLPRAGLHNSGAEIGSGSGSGVAIRHSRVHTDILTAGHVCSMPREIALIGGAQTISLFNVKGEEFAGEVYAIDQANDLCIIRIREKRPIIRVAKDNPDIGDKVFVAGYPIGLYQPGLLHFFEGYFGGLDPDRTGNYSFPSAPGSSGSAIVNVDGELVGIVSAVMVNFHHLTIGPSVEPITIFLMLTENCDMYCIEK